MDLIRLAASITIELTRYNNGMASAERRAQQAAQSIGKSTDSMAAQTEKANNRVVKSYTGVTEAIAGNKNARAELVGSVNNVLASMQEEKRLFEQGKISYEEFTSDIELLGTDYRDATKRLKEFDDMMRASNGTAGKSTNSFKGMYRTIRLLTSAIVMMVRTAVNGIKTAYSESANVTQSASYYNVGKKEYAQFKEAIQSTGTDKGFSDTLLNSIYDISKGINSGDAATSLALSNLGISSSDYSAMSSDVDRARAIIAALQGISDINKRRAAAIELLGDDTGRQIQYLLDSGDFGDIYSAAAQYVMEDAAYDNDAKTKKNWANRWRNFWQDYWRGWHYKANVAAAKGGSGGSGASFASGGMFDKGTLYALAGEAGAEIVARGSRGTGVANIDQIAQAQFVAMDNYGVNDTIRAAAVAIVNGVADVIRDGTGRPINVIVGGEKVESYIYNTANKQTVKYGRRSLDSVTGYGGSK